jgi:pyrimidine-nucleoside phosphorylase
VEAATDSALAELYHNPIRPEGRILFSGPLMTPYEIIQRKQRGEANTAEEISFMVKGALNGQVMEAQLSAWFMAIYFKGMQPEEIWELTRMMRDSGRVFDFSALGGTCIDKHSTGGVGDKITFILAPMLAAAGLVVPSITGRGLGHTGGTLDKMESLPGMKTRLAEDEMRSVLELAGHSLIGQTDDLVPADKLFYALRDVTATVESVPLICSSILSKKLAEGIKGLVLDVKHGHGAIFRDAEQAATLAGKLVEIAQAGKLPVAALLTDMNAPLGRQIGNWNEMVESDECLMGHGSPDLMEVSLALGVAALELAGFGKSPAEALELLKATIETGKARELFHAMLKAQGADIDWLLHPHHAPRPSRGLTVTSTTNGHVADIDSRVLGLATVSLGAGRKRKEDDVDPLAGISIHKHVNERVRAGEALCDIYCSGDADLEELASRVRDAWKIGADSAITAGEELLCDTNGTPWRSRVSRCMGTSFSAEDWQKLVREKGLGLKAHPYSSVRHS